MKYLRRHIEKDVMSLASEFKAVLVTGARQVGKSTLLRHLFPDTKMVEFNPIMDLWEIRQDPNLFLNNSSPLQRFLMRCNTFPSFLLPLNCV